MRAERWPHCRRGGPGGDKPPATPSQGCCSLRDAVGSQSPRAVRWPEHPWQCSCYFWWWGPAQGDLKSGIICLRQCSLPRAQHDSRVLLLLFSGGNEKQMHWAFPTRCPRSAHVHASMWWSSPRSLREEDPEGRKSPVPEGGSTPQQDGLMGSGRVGSSMAFSPWVTHSEPSETSRVHPVRGPRQVALGQGEQAFPRPAKGCQVRREAGCTNPQRQKTVRSTR